MTNGSKKKSQGKLENIFIGMKTKIQYTRIDWTLVKQFLEGNT